MRARATRQPHAIVEQAVSNPDGRERRRAGLLGGSRMFAAHRDVFRVLYSMAQLDANAVGGAVQRLDEARARGMATLAQALAEQGLLRADVSADGAAQVLWLLTSFDAFDALYTGRKLPLDEVVELLTTTAERALYP